jgi:hypothetical protein
MKPGNRPPKIKRRQLIPARKRVILPERCAYVTSSVSACFTYLSLLDFRDCYYARRGLLDHLSSNGFD